MSSEPVKSVEIDCPVSPYSQHHNHLHHHHHHHVLTRHHPHNHLGHSKLEIPSKIQGSEEEEEDIDDDEEVDGDVEDELDDVQIEKIKCLAQNKLKDCNDRLRCTSTHLRHQNTEQNKPNIDDLSVGFLTSGCSGLTGSQVTISDSSDRYELANSTIASSTSTSPTSLHSSSPPSSSSSSKSSSSIGDGDDEDEDDDDEQVAGEIDEDDERVSGDEEEDDEDEDDEDEASSEEENDDDDDEDCEDIVDPVGNHHSQGNANCNEAFSMETNECNGMAKSNPIIEESVSDDESDEEDEDVSFDENDDSDDTSEHQTPKISMIDLSANSSDLLDSERMLEVTRKLVRSTERDPDRDLRKQVLLKTAIRRLPHFMEYNHYPDNFDQSFQLHSNNINCNSNDNNDATVNCLSTAQYYEHHHHHHLHIDHHIDSQPKSYYHSVQPNAIQMSTTSLRMLDLNDDQESEPNTIIDAGQQQNQHYLNHHLGGYRTSNEVESSVQTSLEAQQQHPHDYATHSQQTTLNMYHYPHQSTETHHQHISLSDVDDHQNQASSNNNTGVGQDNHQVAIQKLSTSPFAPESGTNMIAHHETIDSLYQPMASGDTAVGSDGLGVVDESASITFPVTCNYTSVNNVIQNTSGDSAVIDIGDKDCLSEIKTFNNLDNPGNEQTVTDISTTTALGDPIDQKVIQQQPLNHYPDCHLNNSTTANVYFDSNLGTKKQSDKLEAACDELTSPTKTGMLDERILTEANLVADQSSLLETSEGTSDGNSNSSSHSSSSSDEGFLAISRPNDSADDLIANASLLETSLNSTNDYHHSSHDSGLALFSPRSNKRSSSSIGLDDEMDIDHFGDLASISQQSSNSGSNINHCKKLRKKEVMD